LGITHIVRPVRREGVWLLRQRLCIERRRIGAPTGRRQAQAESQLRELTRGQGRRYLIAGTFKGRPTQGKHHRRQGRGTTRGLGFA
jgi:hypothetical protein